MNLSKPCASLIWRDSALFSKRFKVVISSKFLTLSSILPISFMVYLRFCFRYTLASSTFLRYAGRRIVASSSVLSCDSGGIGCLEGVPCNKMNSPFWCKTNLSILGR